LDRPAGPGFSQALPFLPPAHFFFFLCSLDPERGDLGGASLIIQGHIDKVRCVGVNPTARERVFRFYVDPGLH
jgi:hypothetical protein